jgi:hypothetical protein
MPVYEITAPDGRVLEIEGTTSPTEQDLDGIFANLPPKKEAGVIENIKNSLKWTMDTSRKAMETGYRNVEIGTLESKDIITDLDFEEKKRLEELENKPRPDYGEIDNFTKRAYIAAFESLPVMFETLKSGVIGGGAAASTAIVAGQLGPQVGIPEEIVTVPTAGIWGFRIAAGKRIGEIEAGLARSELKKSQKEDGTSIDEDVVNLASLGVGGVNALLEMTSLSMMLKTFPQGKVLLNKLQKGALNKALKNKTVQQQLANVAKAYGKSAITEGVTEAAQESTVIIADALISELQIGDELDKQAGRILDAGVNGFGAALFIGGAGSTITTTNILVKQGMDKATAKKKAEAMSIEEQDAFIQENIEELKDETYDFKKIIDEEAITEPVAEVEVIEKPETAIKEIEQKVSLLEQPDKVEEYKTAVKEAINTIKDISAKDKVKLINNIFDIKTAEQFNTEIQNIIDIANTMQQVEKRTILSNQITKELKIKPVEKVSGIRKAKFGFEETEQLKELKRINKLKREIAQEEFDVIQELPDEGLTFNQRLKNKMLEYKRLPQIDRSEALLQSIIDDIQELKRIGKEVKTEKELQEKLAKKENIQEFTDKLEASKADAEAIGTKALNTYRRGFANVYSLINSLVGKNIAEKYDTALAQNKKNTVVFSKSIEVTEKASKSLEVDKAKFVDAINKLSKQDYELIAKDTVKHKISKLDIIDIYNSIKNENTKENYYKHYDEGQITNLISELTAEEQAFGDYLQEVAQGYYDKLNKAYIESYGLQLPRIENYWMRTSEKESAVDIFQNYQGQSNVPSAFKARAASVIPIPKSAYYKLMKHINQAEHIENIAPVYKQLKEIVEDRKVKSLINNKFGRGVYDKLRNEINELALSAQSAYINDIDGFVGKLLSNWVKAKIALNPSIYLKQLTSVNAYMSQIPAKEWHKHFFDGLTSPKKTMQFMMDNAEFLKARYNRGFDEAIEVAMNEAKKMSGKRQRFDEFMTSLVRGGDIQAIVYGGYPVVKYHMSQGKSLQEAIEIFEKITIRTQQSGVSSALTGFQKSLPTARFFTAFKNTPFQYTRAMVDSSIQYGNGEISTAQFAKTMAIFGAILPSQFAFAGFTIASLRALPAVIRGEEEIEFMQLWLDTMQQILLAPFNAFPVLIDLLNYGYRKVTKQRAYKIFRTPLLDEAETAAMAISGKDVSGSDVIMALSTIAEVKYGVPLKTLHRNLIKPFVSKKKKSKL